jgi:putative phosphoesterase
MLYALLSDIHANLPALKASLKEVSKFKVKKILVAGDTCGKGPFPFEVISILREIGAIIIKGNSDKKFLSTRVSANKLTKKEFELVKFLSLAPETLWVDDKILLCHGSPQNVTDYIYPSITRESLLTKLDGFKKPEVLCCGHSHIPFVKEVDDVLLVNSGSVGKPIDGDPRGSFAVFELNDKEKWGRIIRFEYDLISLVEALKKKNSSKKVINSYLKGIKND